MTVEIRELVIRCEVRGDDAKATNEAVAEAVRTLRRDLARRVDQRVDEALRRSRER